MKKLILLLVALLLVGCAAPAETADIAATTLPVYEFTSRLCQGTDLTVTRLVTESVSCLHDYALNVRQVRAAEAATTIVISGVGLEEFMEDLIHDRDVVNASAGIPLLETETHHHEEESHEDHHHEEDPHIWLDPHNAAMMAETICGSLSQRYPQHADLFRDNLTSLLVDIQAVDDYASDRLADLSCRDLITFHDGFGYMARRYDLHILEAVEEESGSEASAQELKHLISIVRAHDLPAVFTESNGSDSAACIIAAETDVPIFTLDMAMAGDSWFDAMYHNIDTLKEALG